MYYYQVADATYGVYGTGSFMTAPATGKTHVKFLAQGDSRNQTWGLDGLMAAMTWFYQQPGNAEYQRMSIHNGDWVSSDGETYWTNQWLPAFPTSSTTRRMCPSMGAKGTTTTPAGTARLSRSTIPIRYPNLTPRTGIRKRQQQQPLLQ